MFVCMFWLKTSDFGRNNDFGFFYEHEKKFIDRINVKIVLKIPSFVYFPLFSSVSTVIFKNDKICFYSEF